MQLGWVQQHQQTYENNCIKVTQRVGLDCKQDSKPNNWDKQSIGNARKRTLYSTILVAFGQSYSLTILFFLALGYMQQCMVKT